MEFKEIKDIDLTLLKKIVEIEEEAFEGSGNVDLWILKALIRYGRVFILEDRGEIISIAEYMQVMDKKEVFLYGLSTRKKYRHQGWAKLIMKESEKYLKDMGYREIALTVAPENKIAIDMYKKMQFKVIEFQENEYGEGVHRYLMKKVII